MAEQQSAVAVAEPEAVTVAQRERAERKKPKRLPPFHVILWNDEEHTYQYVMCMLQKLFSMPLEKGFQVAKEVDTRGKAVVMTTTKELAELKRDQIHAYGKDPVMEACKGSMWATIEPSIGG